MAGGDLRDGLNLELLGAIPCPLPPIEEQAAIATFLDRETGKIDALIAEQEKLLALLAEKRQATISHAVTKGLNPDTPMKESGVAWLGKVPEHWEILKGARIGTLFGSGPVAEDEVHEEGSVPFIKVGSLSAEGFEIANWNWYVSEATAGRLNPYSEFVVFPKRGAAIFLNKVNIVKCRALIDPNLMGWKIRQSISSAYVAYLLTVRKLQELADVSTVPQINNKHIEPEKFPIPPLSEQEAIVEFVSTECQKIDALKAESERAIALLKERRSALIAAAVTGQIDVRGLVTEPEAA
jgi:type I restriction enzyme S subunit